MSDICIKSTIHNRSAYTMKICWDEKFSCPEKDIGKGNPPFCKANTYPAISPTNSAAPSDFGRVKHEQGRRKQ